MALRTACSEGNWPRLRVTLRSRAFIDSGASYMRVGLPRRRGRKATRNQSRHIKPQLGLVAGPESCSTGQMTPRSRRRDRELPGVPPAPGALGLPAVPAGKPAHRRAARLARTLRTRWWPRFLLAGALLVAVGATLLSGMAETVIVGFGALIIFIIFLRSLSMSDADYRREPPTWPRGGS